MARGILGTLAQAARQAQREAERARKEEERAQAKAARADESERKRLEKEAKAAHIAAREAEAEELNAGLREIYESIDGLLADTLDRDDYVDLESLKKRVEHPPFDRSDLEEPLPKPQLMAEPPEPVLSLSGPPTGLFARKKKHARTVAVLEAEHAAARAKWLADLETTRARNKAALEEHDRAEKARLASLDHERARYAKECEEREAEISAHNQEIDSFIANLGYGTTEAVQEYVSIVMSNSIYPEQFPVDHEFTFDPSTAELTMTVRIPPPSEIPNIKAYKYKKSADEITTTTLSQKEQKERYSGAVYQVALRSLHEVYESDRRGLVRSISLVVGTETTRPATGEVGFIPLVAVGVDRETFLALDLSAIVPVATLEHLGAAVSKNPSALVAADTTGIRLA